MADSRNITRMPVHGIDVVGVDVDPQTRCGHYHSEVDIIAIRFPCCGTYYPCYECHQEAADHPAAVWDKERFGEKAILCGACGHELTIDEYMGSGFECPACRAAFNHGCKTHYHLYFEDHSERKHLMTHLREMTIHDYEQVISLWSETEGLVLSEADSKPNIDMYLTRNAGLSFVWEQDGAIVGTILAGHDGRRGYVYHVTVHPHYRKRRIGEQLVRASLDKLHGQGIDKCHLFVIDDNEIGHSFWKAAGWERRSGFCVYSINTK